MTLDATTVGAIMTRDVVTVGLDDTVNTVRETFEHHGFHHLIVVDHGCVVGVVSDRDLLQNLSPFVGKLSERTQDAHTLDRRVHQIMTRRPTTVGEDTTVCEAAGLMLAHGVSCLPVVDDAGRSRGVVTIHDVLRWAMRTLCEHPGAACPIGRPDAA